MELDGMSWYEIQGSDCGITLEQRPHYCDRGNWLAKIHIYNSRELSIDHQDAWPRYYMDLDRAKLEIEDWMKKRGQMGMSVIVAIGPDGKRQTFFINDHDDYERPKRTTKKTRKNAARKGKKRSGSSARDGARV